MTYAEQGDRVTLEMSRDEHMTLILMAGFAAGAASRFNDREQLYTWVKLANAINEGNPNWTPYEIPEGFR